MAVVDAQNKNPKQNMVITMDSNRINDWKKKLVVKQSGKKPTCKTILRGAGALVYLHLSSFATKGRNICAAGVRPDAPLFHHEVKAGTVL